MEYALSTCLPYHVIADLYPLKIDGWMERWMDGWMDVYVCVCVDRARKNFPIHLGLGIQIHNQVKVLTLTLA